MTRADFRPIPFRLPLGEVAALAQVLACLEARQRLARGSRSLFRLTFRLTTALGKWPTAAVPAADSSKTRLLNFT